MFLNICCFVLAPPSPCHHMQCFQRMEKCLVTGHKETVSVICELEKACLPLTMNTWHDYRELFYVVWVGVEGVWKTCSCFAFIQTAQLFWLVKSNAKKVKKNYLYSLKFASTFANKISIRFYL